MEKEFIPYELALELKELGFDEPCFAHFVKHYDEIKICNKLVKDGFLYKGKPNEKNSTIAFYITDKGNRWLENQK